MNLREEQPRQIALHAGLVPANYLEKLRSEEAADNASSGIAAVMTTQEKARLQAVLFHAEEDSEEVLSLT